MIEIHQSAYNSVELNIEVISAIRAYFLPGPERVGKWTAGLEEEYVRDIDTLNAINADPSEIDVQPQDIEEGWRALATEHGLEVLDDGEAGWTYVGPSSELIELFPEV